MSPAKENYKASDRELFGMIYFLQRFCCYLEGSEFKILTENQVLKSFFNKAIPSRRKVMRLEFMSQFGINELKLVKRKVHVLGDAQSRALHIEITTAEANITILQTLSIDYLDEMMDSYKTGQVFKRIYMASTRIMFSDLIKKGKVECLN